MYNKHKMRLIIPTSIFVLCFFSCQQKQSTKPNILFLISDDQSFPHTSVSGCKFINTPAFDKIANEGVLFANAFAASPGCSPSRAAILTGKYPWQIEKAGTHASSFPAKFRVFPDILEGAGYFVGFTGKGWAPGDFEISGRKRNPAGNEFSELKLLPPYKYISTNDYSGNFKQFYNQKSKGQPFYFWMGFNEPHRDFEKDIWKKEGKNLAEVDVPLFLPDVPEIRGDIMDYTLEIEWFDKQVQKTLKFLEEKGELNNTIVVITSDNGMAFPRAKANCFEFGIHVPLAIRWGDKIKFSKKINELVSLIDLTPTFLEAAGIKNIETLNFSGKSLLNLLFSEDSEPTNPVNNRVFSARERHSYSRYKNAGYPQRAIRTNKFLYIKNYKPELWPAGDPIFFNEKENIFQDAYFDIDDSPSKQFLLQNKNDQFYKTFLDEAVGKRPAEELYDIINDPNCLQNLKDFSEYDKIKTDLKNKLTNYLKKTGDPREQGTNTEIFESYPRLRGPMRSFPKIDLASRNHKIIQ